MRFRLCLLAALAATGCASPRVPFVYTAQNSVRGQAAVQVGNVSYVPADTKRVAPNQLENTAMGSVKIDTEVSTYVKRALALELDRSGFTGRAPEFAMDCSVERIKLDDLGFSVDWTFSMGCKFRRLDAPDESFSRTATVEKKKLAKFGSLEVLQRYLNGIIVDAYEQIMAPETVRALSTPRGTPLPASDPIGPGAILYTKDGATFGRVTERVPGHLFADGTTGDGVHVALPSGTAVWLTTDQAGAMAAPAGKK